MDFKDKINEATKEGNLDHIAELSKEALEQERDQQWLDHGGNFGYLNFPNIDDDDTDNNDKNENKNTTGNESYSELIAEGFEVHGDARRPTLIRLIEFAIKAKKKNESLEKVLAFCKQWNQRCCKPEPLSDQEFEACCQDVINRKEQESEQNKKFYEDFFDNKPDKEFLESIFPELKGNIYYRINERPAKFIVAFKGTNHLIEIEAGLEKSYDKDGRVQLESTTKHNRTFLMCIPTKIVRHINPFLDIEAAESAPKCSITFLDRKEEKHIFAHRTLAATISSLKEHHYVLSDGADSALAAIIQGFKEMGELKDNQDIDVEGFFINKETKKISESNVDIVKELNTAALVSALNFIDEVTKYYKDDRTDRLDLLATLLVWGVIAPIIFILKTTDYYLEDLYLHGASNALKTTSGRIILAIDGHHDDPKYSLKFTHIDTVPRFGNKISKSTFPLLIDEVDLNNPNRDKDKERLINAIKIACDSKIVRQKFESSSDTDPIPIPALSPLILTSNFPPPIHNVGFMKRMIDRHHAESESKRPNDEESIACKEFMRTNLGRLSALGDFRNWYVINNQDFILNPKRKSPLDLGFEILTKAYEHVDKPIPEWLSRKLPQNQLEQAVQDNALLVKRAFVKYINDRYARAISTWRAVDREAVINFEKKISYRLKDLGDAGLLKPDVTVKIDRNGGFTATISRGILEELYQQGITHDQCPNLRQLADYMPNAKYPKIHGKWVIKIDQKDLCNYFDAEDDIDDGTSI